MNWYLNIKFLHVIAVTVTIGGMFTSLWAEGKSLIMEEAIDYPSEKSE